MTCQDINGDLDVQAKNVHNTRHTLWPPTQSARQGTVKRVSLLLLPVKRPSRQGSTNAKTASVMNGVGLRGLSVQRKYMSETPTGALSSEDIHGHLPEMLSRKFYSLRTRLLSKDCCEGLYTVSFKCKHAFKSFVSDKKICDNWFRLIAEAMFLRHALCIC